MLWTIGGSIIAILGVVLLAVGTYQGNKANSTAHESIEKHITKVDEHLVGVDGEIAGVKGEIAGVKGDVGDVKGDVATLRTEMLDSFDRLSEQITASRTAQ